MDRWDRLEAFVRTAEAGSLSRAAKDLGMTQPAVSKRLEHLEREIGVRLLDRTSRGVRLTAAGAHYLDVVRRLRSELDEEESALVLDRKGLVGRLRISVPLMLGEIWLTRLALRFQVLHPGAVLELSATDRVVDLVEDAIDVAVRQGVISTQSVVARPLGSYRSCLVASPGYLAAHGVPADFEALTQRPYFCAPSTNEEEIFLLHSGQRLSFRPSAPVRLSNPRAVLTAALEGAGIARVPVWACDASVQRGELVRLLPELEPPLTEVSAVYLPSRYVPQRVRDFVAFLAEALVTLPGWVTHAG